MADKLIDTSLLDEMIIGRVDPSIYAFTTQTIPNYLKVGDTYRPVNTRLNEWRIHFPDLKYQYSRSAMLESGKIFRDYAVHDFLIKTKGLHRLERDEIEEGVYYSSEFFKDGTSRDVDEAIEDIRRSDTENDGKYQFFTTEHLPIKMTYKRDAHYTIRDNQREAIEKFKTAVDNGHTNLLMYAVMRFGKSFTAMCCAVEMKARFVVIVSAKATLPGEWKETVERPTLFEGFSFYTSKDLADDYDLITKELDKGNKIALFLTLQDLQGETIKTKHQQVFAQTIDLLIIDETHFGARAEQYGKVLKNVGIKKREIENELATAETFDEFDKEVKVLKSKVRLHLSGTPYRILMGDEFSKEEIISFCQYTNIIDAKEQWDLEHKYLENYQEWNNPYYGFPTMIRFAFCPNASSVQKMKEMREKGITYAFSSLFRPFSLVKTADGKHKKFVNEKEILELLEVIDGTRNDENLLGFLDYDKIKQGKMCRHLVCVLPFRASCDALESLISQNKDRFKNLCNYEIINIAGVNDEQTYSEPERVKAKIKECEEGNRKTITLTVNKMLTGSTVKYWDTMLYFKDTASPQEYDQAIFRIQNPYIETYTDSNGNVIKYDMKPQTLLVDFDPDRLFRMQELKAQVYNANLEKNGNEQLVTRIDRELEISPIITINHNLLKRVEAADVMAVVLQYSQSKSIMEESTDIPLDFSLLNDNAFRTEIEGMNEIDAQKGIEFRPNQGGDENYEIPDELPTTPTENIEKGTKEKGETENEDEQKKLAKKIAAYYSKILFYSFLTEAEVKSLEAIIYSIANGDNENRRIAKSLGLKVPILWFIQHRCNPFVLSKLDYKIERINKLMHDNDKEPLQRAEHALSRFARVSDSEIITPPLLVNELVDLLPSDAITLNTRILDIASVQGEFACALLKKYGRKIAHNIYSIPTSALAYELTRKLYRLLNLPVEHIFDFYSRHLIDTNNDKFKNTLQSYKFDIVLGVPPFREKVGGGRGDGGNAIYHRFFNFVKDEIRPRYIAMMMQSTWYSGGRGEGLNAFRDYMLDDSLGNRHIKEFHDYPNIESYVKGVTTLRGGICLFLWDKEYDGDCKFINRINHHDYEMIRPLKYNHDKYSAEYLIRWNKGLEILGKVLSKETHFIYEKGKNLMFARNPFGFPNTSDQFPNHKTGQYQTKVYLSHGSIGYARDDQYDHTPSLDALKDRWKVMVAKSSSGGDELPHRVISKPIVSEPGSVTANTHYIIDGVPTEKEAKNLAAYMRTRFFRFMVNLLRSNQNMRIDMYQFAPRLDFTRPWTDAQLYKKYGLDKEEIDFINMIIKEIQ